MYQDMRSTKSKYPPHIAAAMLYDVNKTLFAEALGITRMTLSMVLHGKRKASRHLDEALINLAEKVNNERQNYWKLGEESK